jgi:hypothetical protein
MNYTGIKCPVCGKPFQPGDDIVVCPICGAPYHRECYERVGKCAFSDRHGTFTWTPPRQAPQPDGAAAENAGTKRCPRCGAPNPKNALFCSHCGLPLSGNGAPYGAGTPRGGGAPGGYPGYGYPGGGMPFGFDPLGGVAPTQDIGGVPAGDLAKFVQSNTQYYLPLFRDMKLFGRNRFNFSSFLFSGMWMLYRKQYRVGAIFAAAMGALTFLYFYISSLCYPAYLRLMEEAGIVGATLYGISGAQWMRLSELIYALPAQQQVLLALPGLLLLVKFILMLVAGFIGNRLYLKFCLSRVGQIRRESSQPGAVAARLQEEGGVNMAFAVVCCICFLILSFFLFQ